MELWSRVPTKHGDTIKLVQRIRVMPALADDIDRDLNETLSQNEISLSLMHGIG